MRKYFIRESFPVFIKAICICALSETARGLVASLLELGKMLLMSSQRQGNDTH